MGDTYPSLKPYIGWVLFWTYFGEQCLLDSQSGVMHSWAKAMNYTSCAKIKSIKFVW